MVALIAYPFDRECRWGIKEWSNSLMIDVSYPALLDMFGEYKAKGRTDSACFLMWYLENVSNHLKT